MKKFWLLRFPIGYAQKFIICDGNPPSTATQILADYIIDSTGQFIKALKQHLIGKPCLFTKREIYELKKLGYEIPKECFRTNAAGVPAYSLGASISEIAISKKVRNECECGSKNPIGQGHSHWCRQFKQEF